MSSRTGVSGDRLRIGFVGCGLIARHHAANLVADPRAQIVAVTDLDADRARRFAAEFCPSTPGPVAADVDAVIEAADAIYVCTWTSAHPPAVLAAAAAGRAVFCEKPLAVDLAGAAAMTEAVVAAGVVNQVGLILRRSPAFRLLRHRMAEPGIGPIMNVVFRDDQYLPTQGLYGSDWRADVTRAGGGTLLEHSIHDLDLLEWMMGPVTEVSARLGSVHGLPGIDDQATVTLIGRSGVQATLVSVWHDVLSRPSQRRVEVFARGAHFSLEGDWHGPVRWDRSTRFESNPPDATGTLAGEALTRAATEADGLAGDPDRAFVDAVLDGTEASPTFAVALRAHELADAAYRSAAAGGAVIRVDGSTNRPPQEPKP